MLVTAFENMLRQEGKDDVTLLTISTEIPVNSSTPDKEISVNSSTPEKDIHVNLTPVQEKSVMSNSLLSSAGANSWDENIEELVIITEKDKQLCLLVEEAKELGVIDFAC